MYAQPLPVALFGQLLHHVAGEGRGIDDVVGRLSGVEHRESVVVARRDADVAGARLAECRYPRPGVEFRGVEPSGELLVLAVVEVEVGHGPFALPEHGIEPPVEEDAETAVGEGLACGKVFRCRHIARLGPGPGGEEERTAEEEEFFHHSGSVD